ncbi:MAG: dimethyl sulfoxide reductase anchor subunit family protein [Alphaproteobacteria bacterium]
MHPSYSVILFTTASGAGYGMLVLLGLGAVLGQLPADRWFGFVAFAISLGLVTLGLLSSTFHLGHPERSWRAVTQWRSSWLSREGVVALATYVPAGLFAAGWVLSARNGGVWAWLGALAAVLAAVTVGSTGMIYASLKTIPRWSNAWVTPIYLALALSTGSLWFAALLHLFSIGLAWADWLAVVATVIAWGLKLGYWRHIDREPTRSTAESATGLAALGAVRLLEAPHTQENFVMREMGFRVARRHARPLRRIALLLGGLAPVVLAVVAASSGGIVGVAAIVLAAASASIGVLIERWLFFAEARHVVTLFYGAAKA